MGCHFLLQGIFLTQGSNPGLLHCRQILDRIWALPLRLSWERIRLQCRRPGLDPRLGKIPWRRERLPTPAFWPGESHGLYSLKVKAEQSEVAQSCPTPCDPVDCSPPGSSVRGIFQAIVLEWTAISFSRGSSQPRDRTRVNLK